MHQGVRVCVKNFRKLLFENICSLYIFVVGFALESSEREGQGERRKSKVVYSAGLWTKVSSFSKFM